jgi:hypothetical protein
MTEKAKESAQILKARKKIERKLQMAEKKINPEALQTMSKIIKEQLNRQKDVRIDLKARHVTFDENKHSAKTQSKFITKLINQIKHNKIPSENELEGRIWTIEDAEF